MPTKKFLTRSVSALEAGIKMPVSRWGGQRKICPWKTFRRRKKKYIYIYIYMLFLSDIYIYIYIYIYISSKCPENNGYGIFVNRKYEGFHIILWEYSMYANYYMSLRRYIYIYIYIYLKSTKTYVNSVLRMTGQQTYFLLRLDVEVLFRTQPLHFFNQTRTFTSREDGIYKKVPKQDCNCIWTDMAFVQIKHHPIKSGSILRYCWGALG